MTDKIQTDPLQEKMDHDEWMAKRPKKIVASAALFFNQSGELLVIKPTYKDGWSLPGGAVEEHESPLEGCTREVKEEIGLDIDIGRLLVIDYRSSDGDSLQFIFHGGVLSDKQITQIKLQESEVGDFKFVSTKSAIDDFLRPNLARRMPFCLKAMDKPGAIYIEFGKEV